MVSGWLDWVILEVFSNLNDSMILWSPVYLELSLQEDEGEAVHLQELPGDRQSLHLRMQTAAKLFRVGQIQFKG